MNIDTHRAKASYADEALTVVGGSLTLDRTRVPFAEAQITVKDGHALDARLSERVRVSMRQDFASADTLTEIDAALAGADLDTIDAGVWAGLTLNEIDALYAVPYDGQSYRMRTHVAANLGVRSTAFNVQRRETTISLASDEAFADDYKSILTYPLGFGTDLRTTVEQALRYIGARLAPGVLTFTLETAPVWEPGESLWDFLSPLVTAAGLLLYADHRRVWRLVSPEQGMPGGVTLSGSSTIVGAESTIDRDEDAWADAVLVVYRHTDTLGVTIERFDAASVPRPTKTLTVTYERTRYPGPGAAAAILDRISRRGRQVPVEAVNDYTARPGMNVTLAVAALGDAQQGKVKAVSWRMRDGEWRMNLDAYDLETLIADAMNAYPDYVMMTDLVGTMNTLNPGEY